MFPEFRYGDLGRQHIFELQSLLLGKLLSAALQSYRPESSY